MGWANVAKAVCAIGVALWFGAPLAFAGELHKAARKGDLDAVHERIAAGDDLNEVDSVVGSPLHWAAARGHLDVAAALLEGGADPSLPAKAPGFLTPLHLAASSGHIDVAELLLEAGADLLAGVEAAGTPLHMAAKADQGAVVATLLDAGADPYAKAGGAYGIYPLHWAAQSGGRVAIDALIAFGFPVDQATEEGTTALHIAVFNANADGSRGLIEAGADPQAVSTYLETPAKLASHHDEMKALFAELGLD